MAYGLNSMNASSAEGNELAAQLKAMMDNIQAIKGNSYAKTVAAIFSVGNVYEAILQEAPMPVEQKQEFGKIVGAAMSDMLGSYTLLLCEIKHPDYMSWPEDKKTELYHEIGGELSKNLDAITNKQLEYWGLQR